MSRSARDIPPGPVRRLCAVMGLVVLSFALLFGVDAAIYAGLAVIGVGIAWEVVV